MFRSLGGVVGSVCLFFYLGHVVCLGFVVAVTGVSDGVDVGVAGGALLLAFIDGEAKEMVALSAWPGGDRLGELPTSPMGANPNKVRSTYDASTCDASGVPMLIIGS